ncbi:MAG: hypothetical protein IPL33_00385 [Sphingobacteriales bacterium]|nr:hypothetical protein [Sphingobacteriales bacterium]
MTYTVGEGPCTSSLTQLIDVQPARLTTLQDITVCESPSSTVNLSAMFNGAAPGGTFTVTGSTLGLFPSISNDVLTYSIGFSDVAPYQVTVEYSLPPLSLGGVCDPLPSTGVITITPSSETGFDLPDVWCVSSGVIDLTQYTTVGGGTYALLTAPEVSIGTTYTPVNGAGLVGITYTPLLSSCATPHTEYIQFLDALDASWTNPSPVCFGYVRFDRIFQCNDNGRRHV